MKKNMGSIDRVIRISLALIIVFLYFNDVIPGNLTLVLLFLVGVFIITSFFSFCPLYLPFRISTTKKSAH